MTTPFPTLGFDLTDKYQREDLLHYIRTSPSQQWETKYGYYLEKYLEKSGIQLWLHLDHTKKVIGLEPHFIGSALNPASIIKKIPGPPSTLSGMLLSWVDPTDPTNPESGAYPLITSSPNFHIIKPFALPHYTSLQITAFVQQILEPQDLPGLAISDQALIPTGVSKQEPTATFAGQVRQSEKVTNELTSKQFYWLTLETHTAVFDVIADPALFINQPRVDDTLIGKYWLSSLIISPAVNTS